MSVYVYAPLTGSSPTHWVSTATCPSGSEYCGTPAYCHPSVRCSQPLDISGSADQWIDFWADAPVKSIVTSYYPYSVCRSSNVPPPINSLVQVDMYTQQGGYGTLIGSVIFAHVKNAYIGTLDTVNPPGQPLWGRSEWAQLCDPSDCGSSDCCDCTLPCPDDCYCWTGPHAHLEMCSASGYNTGLYCNYPMQDASTWLYYW